MKNPNLDDLSEEELKEYLAKNSDEDLTADQDGGPIEVEQKQEQVSVAAEIELPAPKNRRKLATAEERAKRRQEKLRLKQIKKRRKDLKKHPSTLVRYDIDPNIGLTDEIAEQRVIDELTNRTKTKSNRSVFRIIMHNLFTFFNILIFVIAGFLIAVGAPINDFVFLIMVTCNIIIGIWQEINAKKMIDKLSLLSAPTAFVRRSGVEHEVSVEDVVLDDCLLLENGRQICADSIVLDGAIEVNESLLTGESDAILKKPGDQLFSGSFVVSGKCTARVDKIGRDNYIEKLSSQAKQYKAPKSDLYGSLNKIIKFMAFPVIICGGLLFFIMFYRNGIDLRTTVRKTAGAMIGMIPSGLFLMSTIALYVGVIRLGQRNVLVQDVYCVEMLARVDCICLDKTGTITDGTMVVKNVIDYNNVHGLATRNIVSAMLNALQDNNMTSQALKDKFGLGKRIRHTAKIPFSSSRKFQAVTFDKYGTFALGAPEFVLKGDYKRVEKDVNKYAALGYRVLCLAHKEGTIQGTELPEGPIEIIAMILIEDNIRPDAINTIRYFHDSGVEVRVISGDNPITVSKIATRAGVYNADKYVSLDGKSESDVINEVRKGTTVFGRVSPEQKKLIIKTLKDLGKTVAMTGDGVNDILALKEADCSIAVASGSQAVRSCSHLVLLDSNFDSMPSVVSEGRRVINNVAKVAALFLTKTIFSLFLAIEALITGSYPISTNQLIVIEAFAIGLPSLVLVNEPNNTPVKGKFLGNVIREALPGALVILLISAVVFGLADSLSLDSTSLTTIIVIAATHTCMMVLFKVCRPFTTIHKALCGFCYTMFILIIVAVPKFLEIRPIFSFSEYTSNSIVLEYLASYPAVEKSSANYYVVDGKVISLQKNYNNATITLSGLENDGKYYYAINGSMIDTEVIFPNVSYSNEGLIYVGGYQVTPKDNYSQAVKYSDDYASKFTVDENGYLYSDSEPVMITLKKSNEKYGYSQKYGNYSTTAATFHYNVLPKVSIEDGEYVFDGVTFSEYKYRAPLSINTSLSVTIDPETWALMINGEKITATSNTDDSNPTYYIVDKPVVTTDAKTNTMYLEGVNTGLSIYSLYGTTTYTVPGVTGTLYTIYDGDGNPVSYDPQTGYVYYNGNLYQNDNGVAKEYVFTNIGSTGFIAYKDSTDTAIDIREISLKVASGAAQYSIVIGDKYTTCPSAALADAAYAPEIEVTEADKYIINGYYSNYDFSTENLNPHVNSEGYLVLGGVVTDYVINPNHIKEQTGGTVTRLPLPSLIFLIMLCAVAGPIMRLLQNAVPWIVKQARTTKKLLGKIQ